MKKIIDYETICAAVSGDNSAIEKIIWFYSDYIKSLSTIRMMDERGEIHIMVDETMRAELENKLIDKVRKFKIA